MSNLATVPASSELAVSVEISMPGAISMEDKAVQDASNTKWLRRIDLGGTSSNVVKKGLVGQGCFYMKTKDEVIDLGKKFPILVLGARNIAMRFGGKGVKPEVFLNPEDANFKDIQVKSESKDEEVKKGNMWGFQFLMYLPERKEFVSYTLGSPSSRREVKEFMKFEKKAATLKSHLIETTKYSWFGPQVEACRTPFDMPSTEEILAALALFNNTAPAEQEETAGTGEGDGR